MTINILQLEGVSENNFCNYKGKDKEVGEHGMAVESIDLYRSKRQRYQSIKVRFTSSCDNEFMSLFFIIVTTVM